MKYRLSATLVSAALLGFLFLSACHHEDNSNPKDAAENANDDKFNNKTQEKDAQYMVDVASSSMMEVRLSEQARDHASTQEVKDFANAMITAHNALNEKLKTLAAGKQVTLPADLTQKQTDDINDMGKKTGRDYDNAYIDRMISDHKDAISKFEDASNNAGDPDIRKFFADNLPELRHHLDMANDVDQKLDNMK